MTISAAERAINPKTTTPRNTFGFDNEWPEYFTGSNHSYRQIFEISGEKAYIQEYMVAFDGMKVLFEGTTCYQVDVVPFQNGSVTFQRKLNGVITEVFIPDISDSGLFADVKYLSRDSQVGYTEHRPENVAHLRIPQPNNQ